MYAYELLARTKAPIDLKVIRGKTGDREIYSLVEYKQVQRAGILHDIDFYRVEIHPLLQIYSGHMFVHVEELKIDAFFHLTNVFTFTANRLQQVARFGPPRKIVLDENIRSFGLGTWLFNELVVFARTNYPGYRVIAGRLAPGDAEEEENRTRRNRFYRNFGFILTPENPKGGKFHVEKLSDLREHNPGKITKLSLHVPLDLVHPKIRKEELLSLVVSAL